jgi:hypothetical protein
VSFSRCELIWRKAAGETFLYGSGQFVEFCGILLFFRLADQPRSRFYRLIAFILFGAGVSYIPVSLIPLRAAMMLRWLIDASPHIGALLQTAFVIGGMAPLFAFWPLTKLRRSQIPVACACFLWMVTEVPYLTRSFPAFPERVNSYSSPSNTVRWQFSSRSPRLRCC